MITRADVVIIGAGPAGLAAAIAASQNGFRATVLDARMPPLDKPCGEGILPHGVAALRALGIHLDSSVATAFAGIRFEDEESSARADFAEGTGFALRRVRLHRILMDRATQAGVDFHWGAEVIHVDTDFVTTKENRIPYTWLIGADGQNSAVRKWAGLDKRDVRRKRFGFRRHFQVRPWSDAVEVHWAEGCQMFVTPTGEQEVGVAVFSRDPQMRLEQALPRFPSLAEKLSGAVPTTSEMGDTTSLRRFPAVTQGCIALAGDASGTVDAIAGQGLSLSFQHAIYLAEALKQGNLEQYEIFHRKIGATPVAMSRLMLLMDANSALRRRTLRLFANSPNLFSKLLSVHSGTQPLSSIGVGEMADFGWKMLWA
ncbi:MAG TPA: NAD(P)/FAD-dependent oxidoreductase [Candidatus Dormibacteraeota bacterium]|nr:NAD(P)/FAD-dependent oxidoreductase [Candidatus Dormibacteraeota bacterium]